MPPPSLSSYSLFCIQHTRLCLLWKGVSWEVRGPGHPQKTTLMTVSLGTQPRCCFVGRCLNFLKQETQALVGKGRDQSVRCWGSGRTVAAMKGKISLPIFARWLWHNGGSRKLQCDMCYQGPIRVPADGCNVPYSPELILRRGYSLTQQQQ